MDKDNAIEVKNITKDFKVAIALSGILAGGTYDIFHNIEKMRKGE